MKNSNNDLHFIKYNPNRLSHIILISYYYYLNKKFTTKLFTKYTLYISKTPKNNLNFCHIKIPFLKTKKHSQNSIIATSTLES
jgi:hypothetical protein